MNYLLVFLLISSSACIAPKPSVQALIAKDIEQNCTTRTGCKIKISDDISFSWDKLYVFRPGQISSEINELIGTDIRFSEEFSNKYVFFFKNKVVHTEEHLIDFDRIADGTVMFSMADAGGKFLVVDGSSLFDVRIDKRNTGTTYYLTCTNCSGK